MRQTQAWIRDEHKKYPKPKLTYTNIAIDKIMCVRVCGIVYRIIGAVYGSTLRVHTRMDM